MPDLLSDLFSRLKDKGWMMATAESCTGGLISAAITAVPGSSSFFDRGFVTYSNEAKIQMLGVPEETIVSFGAVSEETALAMVEGALRKSRAHLALSVTGIAGPTGGSDEKPVGLVYIGYGLRGEEPKVARHNFKGPRDSVREQSAAAALQHALSLLS
jgi:nicotinamide-nucleotide amidase